MLQRRFSQSGSRVGDVLGRDSWIEESVLKPTFRCGADGLPLHKVVYVEVARGHWKTGAGASIAVAEAMLQQSTDIVICAGDRDQAAIVLEALDGYLNRNPDLARSFHRRGDVREIPGMRRQRQVPGVRFPSRAGRSRSESSSRPGFPRHRETDCPPSSEDRWGRKRVDNGCPCSIDIYRSHWPQKRAP